MKKILIVEDEQPLLEAIQSKLQHEGFQTVSAANGKIGLDHAFEQRPDLILLDLVMPEMDGLTMLEKLRQNEWGSNVPVILLTNVSDWTKDATMFESEANDYLIKSNWKLADIVKKVREHLATNKENGRVDK